METQKLTKSAVAVTATFVLTEANGNKIIHIIPLED